MAATALGQVSRRGQLTLSTKISDSEMSSDLTRHTATAWLVPGEPTLWSVTWLPGRVLTRSQAITAMTIAETVTAHADELADNSSSWWRHIDGWAAELGVTGPHAVAEASLSPEDHTAMPAVITLAFDSEPGRRGHLMSTDPATGMARVRIDGLTWTMPAAHLQYAGGEPTRDNEPGATPRCVTCGGLTDDYTDPASGAVRLRHLRFPGGDMVADFLDSDHAAAVARSLAGAR